MPLGLVSAIVMAGLLVSAPGSVDSPFGGAPLGAYGRAALALVYGLGAAAYFFPLRRSPGRWLLATLAALVLVKLFVGMVAVPEGWRAQYRFGDTAGQTHDARFFWHFASRSYRIEPMVRISDDHSDLHFFNDVPLFGYPPYVPMRRDTRFPMEVTWMGYVDTTTPSEYVVVASGFGQVTLTTVEGQQTWDSPSEIRYPLSLPPGQHRVAFTYTKPAGVPPWLSVLLLDARTGAAVSTTAAPPSSRRWYGSQVTSVIVLAGLALLLVSMSVSYARFGTTAASSTVVMRAVGLSATIVLVGWGTVLAIEAVWRTVDLGAGGDPLVYASHARDILHNGPLMLQGSPLGKAAPYYFYPLYPYLLALAHALVGEDLSAVHLLNGFLLALLPALFLALGWKRLPPVAGIVGFVALTAFVYVYAGFFVTFEEPVFTDFAYVPLVFMALIALARAFGQPSPSRLVLAGAVMALGAATRPSLMTLVYLAPAGLWFALGRRFTWRWAVATMWLGGGVFLGLLPFALRNWIAAGQFVMLVNSWIQIPYFLVPPEVTDRPGGIPGLGEALVMARDIFLAHPVRTITVEARKVLYTLGVTAAGPAGFLQTNVFMVLTVLFAWVIRTRRLRGPLEIALLTFAVSHLAAMVVAAPWTFHYKSILPLHAAFLFAAAFLLAREAPEAPPLNAVPAPPGRSPIS